jgi:hypothetical protein
MNSPKEVLDWVIIMMQRKEDGVKVLLEKVLQPIGFFSPE